MELPFIFLVIGVSSSLGRPSPDSVCENERSCDEQPCFLNALCLSAREREQMVNIRLSSPFLDTSQLSTAIAIIVTVFDDVMGHQGKEVFSTENGSTDPIGPTAWMTTTIGIHSSTASTTATKPVAGQTESSRQPISTAPCEDMTLNPTTGPPTLVPDLGTVVPTTAEGGGDRPDMIDAKGGDALSSGDLNKAGNAEPISQTAFDSFGATANAEQATDGGSERPRVNPVVIGSEGNFEPETPSDVTDAQISESPTTSSGTSSTRTEESSRRKLFFIVNARPASAKEENRELPNQQTILSIVVLQEDPKHRIRVLERELLPLSEMNQGLISETPKRMPNASLEVVVESAPEESKGEESKGEEIKKGDVGYSAVLVAAGVCIAIILVVAVGTAAFRIRRRGPITRYPQRASPEAHEMSPPQ